MDDPPKHDYKKKNRKIMPVAINIGAGAGTFGTGSLVLVGAALVTATLVSALAFKTRRQRRSSSSENINKSRSPPPEVGAPNQLESITKISKDLSAHSLPSNLSNSSDNDEQTDSGDGKQDIIFSVVGEGQESMPLGESVAEEEKLPAVHVSEGQETVFMDEEAAHVNQVKVEDNPQVEFLDEKQEDGHDEIVLENSDRELTEEAGYKDQIVGQPVIEEGAIDAAFVNQTKGENGSQVPFVEKKKNDQKMQYESEQIEGDEAIKAACVDSVNKRDIMETADHEVVLGDQKVYMNGNFSSVAACIMNFDDNLKVSVKENNPPTLLMNEEEKRKETEDEILNVPESSDETLIDETGYADQTVGEILIEEEANDGACVHHVEVQNIPQVQFFEEKENDQQTQYDSGQVMGEVSMRAACDDLVNMHDILELTDHETALDSQVKHLKESGSSAAANIMKLDDNHKVSLDDQTTANEDNPPTKLMKKEEKPEETEEMILEDELVDKDEIPNVELIEEDEDNEEKVTIETDLRSDEVEDEELTPEAEISNQKIQENMEENQTIVDKIPNAKSASREVAKVKKQALVSEQWNLKLLAWSVLISIWCLCHWYSELPFPEVSLAASFLFILMLLGYQNRTTYIIKYGKN